MKARLTLLICLAVTAASSRIMAHHSFQATFDANKPVKVTGTVESIEWTNPHIWFYVDVEDEDGTVTNWAFEMASPNQLMRRGWRRDHLQIGDVVTVEGRQARDDTPTANAMVVTLMSSGEQVYHDGVAGGEPPPPQ